MRRALLLVFLAAVLAPRGWAKDKGPSPRDVKQAIQNGVAWLEKRFEDGYIGEKWTDPVELVVMTLAYAGADRKSDAFKKGLALIQATDLRHTYRVSTMALALSHLNPYKHRERLAHCAQWLVETQLAGGEWGYPGGLVGRKNTTHALKVEPPPMPENAQHPLKAPPIVIMRKSKVEDLGAAKGDFSNTQFAVLALRACMDAKIVVPKETWQAALDYMLQFQREDGGWGYVVAGEQDEASYTSLTCAGVVGVALCLHGLGKKNARSHPAVRKSLKWLAKNWDATKNVGVDRSMHVLPKTWQYYHLYSLERVGSVLGVKKIGKTPWFPAGATWCLANQKADGSWKDPEPAPDLGEYMHTADTCFAILFLARGTPPLTGR